MESYPVTFSVDYPDRPLDRLSSALRIFWVIPIAILLVAVQHPGDQQFAANLNGRGFQFVLAGGGGLGLPVLLMLLFRRKYPRWWFDWNLSSAASAAGWPPTAPSWTIATPRPTRTRPCTSTSRR